MCHRKKKIFVVFPVGYIFSLLSRPVSAKIEFIFLDSLIYTIHLKFSLIK